MKDGFKWHCYKDVKPTSDNYIYAIDPTNSKDKVDIGRVHDFVWNETTMWCYVYIPDAPRKIKLASCSTLKDCSNDYILALEERIEILELQMRNLD
jgi:hypothetical protein